VPLILLLNKMHISPSWCHPAHSPACLVVSVRQSNDAFALSPLPSERTQIHRLSNQHPRLGRRPAPRRHGRPPAPAAALAVRLDAAARAVAGRPRRRAPRRVHAEHLRHLLQVPHRARHGPRAAPPLRGPRQAPRPPRRCAPPDPSVPSH
jgi:hypothetical protein